MYNDRYIPMPMPVHAETEVIIGFDPHALVSFLVIKLPTYSIDKHEAPKIAILPGKRVNR